MKSGREIFFFILSFIKARNKEKKKRTVHREVFLTGFFMAFLFLTSCHGSMRQRVFNVPDDFDLTENYELTFWAKNDTNKRQTDIYRQAISEFQGLYPNIEVTLRLYTDYGDIYNDVITNISTGTTPNICITYPDHIATYMTGDNVVVPLDELMADEKYGLSGSELLFESPRREEIISQFLDECVLGDHIYALPYMRSTEACYINKTYVEALGFTLPEYLTWDFVWEVSEAAAATKGADGTFSINSQQNMIPFIYKSTDNMMIQMLRQKNGDYASENGEILIFNDTTRELLLDIAGHTENGAFSTFKISGYPANFLNAGQCIFAVDSTAGSTWMGTDAPLRDIADEAVVKFETVVRPIPQFDPQNPRMISQGPSICIFNKSDPGEVLASWLFAQYLLTDDVQIAYSETEGYVPVTTRAQYHPTYQDYLRREGEDNDTHYDIKIQSVNLLLRHMNDTFITPVFNGSTSLRDAAGQLIEDVVKSVRRHQKVDDDFIDTLYSDTAALYHLNSGASSIGQTELGPLPGTAVALLMGLLFAWIFILVYFLILRSRNKRVRAL